MMHSIFLRGNVTWTGGYISDYDFLASSDFVKAMWQNSANMDRWIQNLALGMTNNIIQTAPAAENSYYAPIVTYSVPYIVVRWP